MYINDLPGDRQENHIRYNKVQKIGFYESLRWTLRAGRLSGLLPITGLRQRDSRLTKFFWYSPFTLISVIYMSFQFFKICLNTYSTLSKTLTLTRFSNYILNFITFMVMCLHLRFSTIWPRIISDIEKIEKFLPGLQKSSVKKFKITTNLMLIPCLIQIILHITVDLVTTHLCYIQPDDSGMYFKSYAITSYRWVYDFIPFDYFTAIIFQIAKIQNTYMWYFTDTLIIVTSIHLNERFENFNKGFENEVSSASLRENEDHSWDEFREQYTYLMKLVDTVDKYINAMVLLSYSNIIIIGKQVYTILNKKMTQIMLKSDCSYSSVDMLTLLYYFYSVTALLTRTILVSNYGARINISSRKPLNALHTLSAKAYDNNFQRFMDQVYHSNISLSGCQCFYVTREMILTLLASLLTYEIVLLQSKH